MRPVSVVLVGGSPWSADLSDDDLNLRPARALADRLGGRYDVIVPRGAARPGKVDLGSVRLHRVNAPHRPAFLAAARRTVDRLAAGERPVLMSSDPLAALAVECARARRRCPHLVQIQGQVVTPGPEYGGWLKRRALAAAVRLAVRRASGVRVVSEGLRAAVAPMTTAPVAVVRNRVDTAVFAPAAPRGPLEAARVDAAMVGSLLEVKNHPAVVRAWARVVREFPDARLVIVGEGPCRPELQALIGRLGLHRSVELRGRVSQPDVAALLAQARCLAHPSWSEGQPRAVLEGMACGLPVICSDIPAHREIVGSDLGWLVPPDQPETWAAALNAVLRDPAAAAAKGRRARAVVAEHHDFAASIDRFAEFIRVVAANDPPRAARGRSGTPQDPSGAAR